MLVPLGLVTGLVTYLAVFWAGELLPFAALLAAAFLYGLLGASASYWDSTHASIVPYFQSPVPGPSTFCTGEALARHLGELDELAIRLGILPLSAFGFPDDLAGETLAWHDPAWGLETVSSLLERLRDEPGLVKRAAAVIADLELIEARLAEACRAGVPFCFLLRLGRSTSGHEMSLRKGHF